MSSPITFNKKTRERERDKLDLGIVKYMWFAIWVNVTAIHFRQPKKKKKER
jgi:hypothetical protein